MPLSQYEKVKSKKKSLLDRKSHLTLILLIYVNIYAVCTRTLHKTSADGGIARNDLKKC